MSKASKLLNLFEDNTVTVAYHNAGRKVLGEYYSNVDIFGFELWDVASNDPLLQGLTPSKNPYELYSRMSKLSKPKLRKYNSTKQRIGIQRYNAELVQIPDSAWIKLGISKPSKDQELLLQCITILYKNYNVRIFGMESSMHVKDFLK